MLREKKGSSVQVAPISSSGQSSIDGSRKSFDNKKLEQNFSLRYLSSNNFKNNSNKNEQSFKSTIVASKVPEEEAENDIAEMSRLQEKNEAILKSYIAINPLTLKFDNVEVEKDYEKYFESKRAYVIMSVFICNTVLFQWNVIDIYAELFTTGTTDQLEKFLLMMLLSFACIICYLSRLMGYLEEHSSIDKKTSEVESGIDSARSSRKRSSVNPSRIMSTLADGPTQNSALMPLLRCAKPVNTIRKVLPRDDLVLILCVGTAVGLILFATNEELNCNSGMIFALVFGTIILGKLSYLMAALLELIVFAQFVIQENGAFATNTVAILSSIICFTYFARVTELSMRRDFRLTRRLAAENIDVQVDITTRSWFEFGQSKVNPVPGESGKPKASHNIKADDIELGDTLGSGSFGEVVLAKWRGTEVAVKKVHGIPNQQAIVDFGMEAAIMESIRHPNIVMYLGICLKPVMMVMELMPRGSLHNILHVSDVTLDWSLRIRMLIDAARGMNFLHMLENPLLHNDLKSLNLLIDNDWRCKVCDFGFSGIRDMVKTSNVLGGGCIKSEITQIKEEEEEEEEEEKQQQQQQQEQEQEQAKKTPDIEQGLPGAATETEAPQNADGNITQAVATIGWASPEAIEHEPLTEKNDVYAYGVVIFEVLARHLPFETVNKEAIPLLVLEGKRPSDYFNLEPVLEQITNPNKKKAIQKLVRLMEKCWHQNPQERPSFQVCLTELDKVVELYFEESAKDWGSEIVFPKTSKALSESLTNDLEDSSFQIDPKDLQMGPKIGSGAYGEVYEAIYHGTHVAVKQFFNSGLPAEVIKEFNKECRLMLNMRHPNVVLFMGSWTKPPKMILVTELLTRGSLYYTYNSNPKPKNENNEHLKMILKISEGMALGCNYLHKQNPPVIHRDLKSPNILLDENWNAKVADFGLSRIREEGKIMTSVGSPLWAAPEVLRGEESGFPSDVYSFGVVVWEIIAWEEPYPGMSPSNIMRQVAFNKMRPKLSNSTPSSIRKLLEDCWEDDPGQRPTFEAVIVTLEKISDELLL